MVTLCTSSQFYHTLTTVDVTSLKETSIYIFANTPFSRPTYKLFIDKQKHL